MTGSGNREQHVQGVVVAAQRRFAELGTRTTVRLGTRTADLSLVTADRRVYPLDELLAAALPVRGRERGRLIDEHVGRMVREGPGIDRMDADELRSRVRTRLLPAADASGPSRPFSEELVEGLCIRLPGTVVPVSDAVLARLDLPLPELWALGRRNTAAEPVEERTEVAPGVLRFDGGSPFVAAKAADLAPLVGSPRFGAVVAVPFAGTLLAVPMDGEAAFHAVDSLARALAQALASEPHAGAGVLSDALHFSRDGLVHRISDRDPATQSVRILVTGPFGEALDELEAHIARRGAAAPTPVTAPQRAGASATPGTTGV